MYTQCPECQTIYEIDEDALQASLGIVQCGHCAKRFDALRTLSDTLPPGPRATMPEHGPLARAPTLTTAVPPSVLDPAAEQGQQENDAFANSGTVANAARPEPAVPEKTSSVIPETQRGENAEDWFAIIESELSAPQLPEASNSAAPDGVEDNGWAVELPDEAGQMEIDPTAPTDLTRGGGEDAPATNIDALPGIPVSPEDGAEVQESATSVPSLDTATNQYEIGLEAETLASTDEDNFDTDTPPAYESTEPASTDTGPDDANSPAHVYARPHRARISRAGVAWVAGCVVLALALATQLVWAKRVELFRNPSTHPWMARLCLSVPCRLPPIKDISKLELLSRDVRPDPNAAGALMITATVRNDAAFRQPWPIVVVELTDLDNHPVAMRRFRPAEYMPDPVRRAKGIVPGATAALAFEVADPGKSAVAFQFDFE